MGDSIREITKWMLTYKQYTDCKGVVLGISGGKDSTVVAMLAKEAFGDDVYGVLMPNGEQADLQDAIDVVTKLGIRHQIVDIGAAYKSMLGAIEGCTITEKAMTNIPPRIRMTVLYAIAQSMGYRVIGTGNASERYIGWTTKFGDSACDFNPIAHLSCTKVIEIGKILAKEYGLDEKYIVKTPSDGLCGRSDEDSFGFTYEDLDHAVEYDDQYFNSPEKEKIFNKIVQMNRASIHKRRVPYDITDKFLFEE